MFKHINDLLAVLLLTVIIPGLWIAQGLGKISIPGDITGATIMGWTLVLQYYFRKSPAAKTPAAAAPAAAPPAPPKTLGQGGYVNG